MSVQIRQDHERGCGWRKPGGLYMVCGGKGRPCGKLPIPLCVCPTCGQGIKHSRGWTWVDADKLAEGVTCRAEKEKCGGCPLGGKIGRAGLIWVGGAYYDTPEKFTAEAYRLGISRRVPHVPKDFKVGETWVLLAHAKVIAKPCPDCYPTPPEPARLRSEPCKGCGDTGTVYQAAVFHLFLPSAVEYVVKGDETDGELAALEKRGVTPVKVERVDDSGNVIPEGGEEEKGLFN